VFINTLYDVSLTKQSNSLVGVARILSGCTFFLKKLTTFLVDVAFKRQSEIASQSSHTAKKCPKTDSCSAWGVHLVCWGCIYKFSLLITPKILPLATPINLLVFIHLA